MPYRRPGPPLGGTSRDAVLAGLDPRSPEGRFLARTKRELVAHLGGKPTATQVLMIEAAARLRLRLWLLDAKAFASGGDVSDTDTKRYSWHAGSLLRVLRDLGLAEAAKPVAPRRSLADHLARRGKGAG